MSQFPPPFGPPITAQPFFGQPVFATVEIHFREAPAQTIAIHTPQEFSAVHQDTMNLWRQLGVIKMVLLGSDGTPLQELTMDANGYPQTRFIAA